jgi:predicted  nucleic acid-binding Zn-ribbon protein
LKEQLDLLWELQKIDEALEKVRADRELLPLEIGRLEEKLKIEKEKIQKDRERVETLEKARRQKESHLVEEQDRIRKTEGKGFEVKTNKEYQAFLTELEGAKESSGREEEEILGLMSEIEEGRQTLLRREKEVVSRLAEIEAEKKTLQEKAARGERVWKERQGRSEALAKQVDKALYKLYNTIKEKRQGVAMVGVWQEICQGCFVNVPPQLYIEVQKNTGMVRCPNCSRILYWVPEEKPAEAPPR